MVSKEFSNSKKYYNRELSWLLFEGRVLEEAKDKSYSLPQRIKFLSITASNLDEFFMVRVASLKEMEHAGYQGLDISNLTPSDQLSRISDAVHELMHKQYDTYNKDILVGLEQNNIKLVTRHEHLTNHEKIVVDKFFDERVFPVLTPMVVDDTRDFPIISSKSLNLGLLIAEKNSKEKKFAYVQIPKGIGRVVTLEEDSTKSTIILLEEIIERNVSRIFSKYDIISSGFFRIVRNEDLTISEDDCADLIKEIEHQIKMRQWGEPIRLDVEKGMDPILIKRLLNANDLKEPDIYEINGPLDLTFLSDINNLANVKNLSGVQFVPSKSNYIDENVSLFDQISKKDILLIHPYESFKPVIDFINEAAVDEKVLAIKQTLYRVGDNSPVVDALSKAAENGKQVTVLVEVKARFDEETNIGFARMLEKAGCHVIYGISGLKTHCKMTQVIRLEDGFVESYVHLGTGNYNGTTAKLYTDIGLFTANKEIGEDVTAIFNMLAGGSDIERLNCLSISPVMLRDSFVKLISREKENAINNRPAKIIAKINSLCDKEVIDALYDASSHGVKITLFVRGICCLKAMTPGLSENITVKSIVGTFLEHSRFFYFENGGQSEVYCASSDWMPRNFDRRVEVLFPIIDQSVKQRLIELFDIMNQDKRKARIMQTDGTYILESAGSEEDFSYQEYMIKSFMLQ